MRLSSVPRRASKSKSPSASRRVSQSFAVTREAFRCKFGIKSTDGSYLRGTRKLCKFESDLALACTAAQRIAGSARTKAMTDLCSHYTHPPVVAPVSLRLHDPGPKSFYICIKSSNVPFLPVPLCLPTTDPQTIEPMPLLQTSSHHPPRLIHTPPMPRWQVQEI